MGVFAVDRSSYFPLNMTFLTAAAAGLITDCSRVAQLGTNNSIDTATQPEDVWSGSSLGILNAIDHKALQTPQSPATVEVVSDNANDTAAGTGLRTMLVAYLDATYTAKTTVITLNGTTPVAFPETIMAVNNMVRSSSGTFMGNNTGNISLRVAGGAGATYGYMEAGTGFFRTSAYTVPLGYTFLVTSSIFSINRTDTQDRWARFSLPIMNAAGATAKALVLSISSTSPYRHEADGSPLVIVPEKNVIWVTAEAVSLNSTAVEAGITGVIVKNTRMIVSN